MEIKTFEDLEVWKACRGVRKKVFALSKSLPTEEKYRVGDQLIRAGISATSNIAEGYGQFHYQENIQFSRQCRGSLYEILDHLITCVDNEYLSEATLKELRREVLRAIQLVNGYIRMLQRAKERESQPDS